MIQRSFFIGIALASALVVLGWILTPTTNTISIAGALIILFIYALLAYFGAARLDLRNPQILHIAGIFGLIAGLIFLSEIIWEYIALPTDNTRLGLIKFGSVFALYFLSALVIAYRTQRLRQAVITAISTAMIGSLIWLITVLAVFYIFRGSPRQTQVFRAEGNYEDFAHSGRSDFNAFMMEDFMGAGFFHLLLGPIVAAILGSVGGLIGKVFAVSGKRWNRSES
jgi:hypothetical protein